MASWSTPQGVTITAKPEPGFEDILTPEALAFVATLHRAHNARRVELLEKRALRQKQLDAGAKPDFLDETRDVREGDWSVAPIPEALQRRTVEITGPVDRKMVINALNSGADVFMADFEDANSPTWTNTIEGQLNLRDAIRHTITYEHPTKGTYSLDEKVATLLVRPRGWHLEEKHILIDGEPASASLVDFGLYFFHNARALLENGAGPYFYLPKLESHLEGRLWNDVFNLAQDELGLERGTIKATVLLENILLSYEIDELLYELRDHIAGINAGRWDYIFSAIKKFRHHEVVFPDRAQITMQVPFMRAYTDLLVQTCHKRGAHAIGGMAAFIPSRDPEVNANAYQKVTADKEREARDGFDGTCGTLGTKSAGEDCEFDDECADGLGCSDDTATCETVSPITFGPMGSTCVLSEEGPLCEPGLVCGDLAINMASGQIEGSCQPPKAMGGSCFLDFECGIDAVCAGADFQTMTAGSCGPRYSDGQACENNLQCESANCEFDDNDNGTCAAVMICMVPE